jgi:predicted glycoside hydrolase/deacetylase ChbG (UPF0249 family)
VVNADDLGLSEGVNDGVAEAAVRGIVTSASLMVRWPAAEAAARWARTRPDISIGLHVDLGEWQFRDGTWRPRYQVVDTADRDAVSDQVSRQLERFERLVGRAPTHLDSHQHAHRQEPVRSCLVDVGRRLGVHVRQASASVVYCGEFHGQTGRGEPYHAGVTLAALLAILERLPEGTTELSCHPGSDSLDDLASVYRAERALERKVLCDPRLRTELARLGIELCSFAGLVSAS